MKNWVEGDKQLPRLKFTGVPGVAEAAGLSADPM